MRFQLGKQDTASPLPVQSRPESADLTANSTQKKQPLSATGAAHFASGMVLFLLGIFFIMHNTMVHTGFSLMGLIGFTPPFGLVLLPLLFGIGLLFYNKNSIWGRILLTVGVFIILLGILLGLQITFMPAPLYYVILMYGLTAGGIGLMLKGFWSRHN